MHFAGVFSFGGMGEGFPAQCCGVAAGPIPVWGVRITNASATTTSYVNEWVKLRLTSDFVARTVRSDFGPFLAVLRHMRR